MLAARLAALALVALAAPEAPAAEPRDSQLRLSGRLELGLLRSTYVETGLTEVELDREEGWLPTLTGAVEARADRWHGRLTAGLAAGDLAYRGLVQSGDPSLSGLTLESRSPAQLLQLEARAGPRLGPSGEFEPFLGLAWRRWQREIQAASVTSRTGVPTLVTGLSETYDWLELSAGAGATVLELGPSTWRVEAALLAVVRPRLAVPVAGRELRFELGARPGWRAGLEWRWALDPAWSLLAGLRGEGWWFGESAVDPATGFYEPRSVTVHLEGRLGVELRP